MNETIRAAMRKRAREAASEAPPLTDEQRTELRAAWLRGMADVRAGQRAT